MCLVSRRPRIHAIWTLLYETYTHVASLAGLFNDIHYVPEYGPGAGLRPELKDDVRCGGVAAYRRLSMRHNVQSHLSPSDNIRH